MHRLHIKALAVFCINLSVACHSEKLDNVKLRSKETLDNMEEVKSSFKTHFKCFQNLINEIGETDQVDTADLDRFVYMVNYYLNHTTLLAVKDYKHGVLSTATLCRSNISYAPILGNDTFNKAIPYSVTLKKCTDKTSAEGNKRIFSLLDSLVAEKLLLPMYG